MNLADARRVHFVGIGGAGMSALAKVLLERGIAVSGSDIKRSRAAIMLEALGARVSIGHSAEAVEGSDVVIRSAAIPERNPELAEAARVRIPVMTRGEALASLLAAGPSIVVAGTHGKTTTTSMIVAVLRHARMDPTYLVGAGLNDAGANGRSGKGPFAVAESDESDGSFLLLKPTIAVVTNVEPDHLEHWGSLDNIRAAFTRWLEDLGPGAVAVVPSDDRAIAGRGGEGRSVTTFGDGGDVAAANVELSAWGSAFALARAGDGDCVVELQVPGAHNVLNALAAAAACSAAGVPLEAIAAGLGEYRGVERRFQIRGSAEGVTVIDDYAHHPTEVRATLAAARLGEWRRVVAVFQPHRYSRTAALSGEFGRSFADADRVLVTGVYGAGEEPLPGVTGKLVAEAVCESLPGRPVAYLPHRADVLSYLDAEARPGDALLTLGAGDVTSLGEEWLERRERTS